MIRHYIRRPLVNILNRRPFASDPVPPMDFSKIPESELDNDPNDPQYYGALKKSGIDPMIGDYPLLKWRSAQQRDPYAKYDNPQDKRNFGDPVHHEDELLSAMAPDIYPYDTATAFFQFAVVSGLFFGLYLFSRYVQEIRDEEFAASPLYSYPNYAGNVVLANMDIDDE